MIYRIDLKEIKKSLFGKEGYSIGNASILDCMLQNLELESIALEAVRYSHRPNALKSGTFMYTSRLKKAHGMSVTYENFNKGSM